MKKLIWFFALLIAIPLFAQHGIDATFNRTSLNSIYHAYGGFQDSTVSVAITVNQWSVVTNANKDLWGGTEIDGISVSGDTVTIENTGDYFGLVSVVFEANNGNECELRIYNVTQGRMEGFTLGQTGRGTGSYSSIALPLYFENTAGDEYVMQVTNRSGSNAAVFKFGQFIITYLHE